MTISPIEVTGADIIGALLRDAPSVTALVPVESIKGGRLPDGVQLPAMLVRVVSSNERQMLTRRGEVRTMDRVSVTVRARSYDEQIEIIGAVRRACSGKVGDIGGGLRVSILSAGTGPDLLGPGDSFEQAQDFRVSHERPA